jgi:16S rRNA (guanine(1405)-N(7))-methyltransferase
VGERELAVRRNLKEAVKATKNKLHQVGAAYLPARMHYEQWLEELRRAACSGESDLRTACFRIMGHHASTRERLPILEQFYLTTLREIGPVHSVLDVACGLNPLAIPWMGLPPGAAYFAYDMYEDLMAFLGSFLTVIERPGKAEARDVLYGLPSEVVDLAYLLKAIPCLEQLDKSAGSRLLETIKARHLLVSFPVASLGGKDRHMVANYEARFRELIGDRGWAVQRFAFESELAFLVSK